MQAYFCFFFAFLIFRPSSNTSGPTFDVLSKMLAESKKPRTIIVECLCLSVCSPP